jgi:hypothetical protein
VDAKSQDVMAELLMNNNFNIAFIIEPVFHMTHIQVGRKKD